MFDVIIIGAGPAGTAAAYDLLDEGHRVLILDKYQFPRKKACAGGITPKCLNLFRYDISSVIKQTCRSVKINSSKNDSFLIQSKKQLPLCYMTDRKELDAFSLEKVISKGAVFKTIHAIKNISRTPQYIQLDAKGDSFKSRMIIGADGANSIVRRFFFKSFVYKKQFGIEADVRVRDINRFPMEFDFSQPVKGYFWVFPKENHLNIGVYSVDSKQKINSTLLRTYSKKRFGTDRLEAFKGYPICTHGFYGTPAKKDILLVGDAAGMAEHLLGEGLYFAVKTGQLAAKAIIQSGKTGLPVDYLYARSLKRVQVDLGLHRLASKWFYFFPYMSLKTLSLPLVHQYFAKGYARGKPLVDILTKPGFFSGQLRM